MSLSTLLFLTLLHPSAGPVPIGVLAVITVVPIHALILAGDVHAAAQTAANTTAATVILLCPTVDGTLETG